jgi:hypothetical protein
LHRFYSQTGACWDLSNGATFPGITAPDRGVTQGCANPLHRFKINVDGTTSAERLFKERTVYATVE